MGALLPGQPEFTTTTEQFVVRNIWHKAARKKPGGLGSPTRKRKAVALHKLPCNSHPNKRSMCGLDSKPPKFSGTPGVQGIKEEGSSSKTKSNLPKIQNHC